MHARTHPKGPNQCPTHQHALKRELCAAWYPLLPCNERHHRGPATFSTALSRSAQGPPPVRVPAGHGVSSALPTCYSRWRRSMPASWHLNEGARPACGSGAGSDQAIHARITLRPKGGPVKGGSTLRTRDGVEFVRVFPKMKRRESAHALRPHQFVRLGTGITHNLRAKEGAQGETDVRVCIGGGAPCWHAAAAARFSARRACLGASSQLRLLEP